MISLKKKRFVALIIVAALAGGAIFSFATYLVVGAISGMILVPRDYYESLETSSKKYEKLEQLRAAIDQYYYMDVDQEELDIGIYKGLFWGIGDKYSSYMTKEEYENVSIYTTGELYGIGVTITVNKDNYVEVISVVSDSPAEAAGLKAGDFILAVDGTQYAGEEYDLAASAMRGQPGTKVKISYARGGAEHDVTITRAKIVADSVFANILDDNIGYIRITQFENQTGEDFKKELRNMEMKGVKGLIIDLRNNGGGIVDSSVQVADALMKEGIVAYLEYKDGEKKYFNSDATATALPYVILVNESTASSSEIVAAAIKDTHEGSIVGTTTFGKGVIQSVSALKDGDAIKLTIAQYFSPDGNVINEKGVEPDYVVEITENDTVDKQLNKAIELLK